MTDGFSGRAEAISKLLRDILYTGRLGRPWLLPWSGLNLVQAIKRCTACRLTAIERRLVIGIWRGAQNVLLRRQLSIGVFNTAYFERLNATLLTWMPASILHSQTSACYRPHLEAALFWTSVVYNFVAFMIVWQAHWLWLRVWLRCPGRFVTRFFVSELKM